MSTTKDISRAPPLDYPTLSLPTAVLSERRDVSVARVTVGMTFYLDDGRAWMTGAAEKALRLFLKLCPGKPVWWFTTSHLMKWLKVAPADAPPLLRELTLSLGERPRHLLWVRLADDTGAPSRSFSYREVDTERSDRAGSLQVCFPLETDPDVLMAFAQRLCADTPLWSAVGGYLVTWNPIARATAMRDARPWCRRYLGLDVQDPDAMALHARNGLPGTSWLTFIGQRLANRAGIDLPVLVRHRWKHGTRLQEMPTGLLVQAGAAPTPGDLNRLAYPHAYAEVGHRLGPWLVREPPDLWSSPFSEDDSRAWFERFANAARWC